MTKTAQKRETNLRKGLPTIKTIIVCLLVGLILALSGLSMAHADPSRMDDQQREFNRRAAAAHSSAELAEVLTEAYNYMVSLVQQSDQLIAANQAERDKLNQQIADLARKLEDSTDARQAKEMLACQDRLTQLDAELPLLLSDKEYRDGQLARVVDLLGPMGGPVAGVGTSASAGYTTPPADTVAPTVVQVALAQLGKPYVYGASGPFSFDCSGLITYAYQAVGLDLPHYSYDQARCGQRVAAADLQPGDLVFFRSLGHVGMYIGNGQFVHAPHTGDVVRVATLADRSDFCFACRPGL